MLRLLAKPSPKGSRLILEPVSTLMILMKESILQRIYSVCHVIKIFVPLILIQKKIVIRKIVMKKARCNYTVIENLGIKEFVKKWTPFLALVRIKVPHQVMHPEGIALYARME